MRNYGLLVCLAIPVGTAPMTAASSAENGAVSEIRAGVLFHDAGIVSERLEPPGPDANFEFLFKSPAFLKPLWSPRPHLGATLNPDGATSQGYLGLTWTWNATDRVFAEFSFGASMHSGKTDPAKAGTDEKALGCRPLFRESVSLGYRLTDRNNISIMADHVSNAYLCEVNPGLDTVGVRWGYRF